jgi:putative membrane protein
MAHLVIAEYSEAVSGGDGPEPRRLRLAPSEPPMHKMSRLVLLPAVVLGAVVLTAAPALAAPSDQDVSWMQAAHQSNLAEIAAGNAAQQSATTSDVKQLGAEFVQMHTQLDAALTQAAQQLGVQLPGSPTSQQQQQLTAVQQKTGQAFDTAWIAMQIGGHETALAGTQQELKSGSDSTVVNLARTALPVIQHHLTQLQTAAQKYGVPTSVPGGTGGQAAGADLGALGWTLTAVGALALVAGTVGLGRRRATSA